MVRRVITIATIAALLVSLGPLATFAQDDPKQPAADPKAPVTTAQPQAPATTAPEVVKAPTQGPVVPSNLVAVCGCGKAFAPNASTKAITHGGKSYACCSEACHKAGSGDPAGAAKKADENTAKMMAQLNKPVTTATAPPKSN